MVPRHTPWSWSNWREMQDGNDILYTFELRLYSDSWFIGQALGVGPYSFLNPVPTVRPGDIFNLRPAIVLRVDVHTRHEISDMTVTDDAHYHGGTAYDEIAALVSLTLGARISAAPIDREFTGSDQYGVPRTYDSAFEPTLPLLTDRPQIPSLHSERNLSDLEVLHSLPRLEQAEAIALIKSARLYQVALWFADVTPEISWIYFVSAIETAAAYWDGQKYDARGRLELSFPRIVRMLKTYSNNELIDNVAHELEGVIGSTGKFVGFMKTFKPEPPTSRPKAHRFNFSDASYIQAMKRIYHYRSKALHGGIPFPHPMCSPPIVGQPPNDSPNEAPLGLSTSSLGATWRADDTPMLLHLFAYIVQRVLLDWWKNMA